VGRCRTEGVVPLSPTLDTVGPMTRSLDDLMLLWSVMADPDGGVAPLPRPGDVWHIGTLDDLFGAAPEESEVSAFARAALERWQKAGAHLSAAAARVDDARLQAANVTGYEFRDALARCLRDDGLAVRSLTDILDGGYPHPEAMPILRERDALRDTDGSLRTAVLGRAQTIRAEVLAALAVGSLDVLVYPSSRRAPALLGEPQRGGNGLLAAVTGLPALSVPIGFTSTGIPVGLDLLGPPGSESRLLLAARQLDAALRAG
ncbi:MAG: amidase family protein, partial [Achromobacter pestifer]